MPRAKRRASRSIFPISILGYSEGYMALYAADTWPRGNENGALDESATKYSNRTVSVSTDQGAVYLHTTLERANVVYSLL